MRNMETLEIIREAVRKRPEELTQARKRGEQVAAYLCCYTPEEVIDALGLIPLRICRGGNEEWLELGSQYTSTKNCTYIREVVGMFIDGRDPLLTNSDFIALTTADLEMGRAAEVISYYCKISPIVLDMPRSFDEPASREYFKESMKDFTAELEKRSGRKLEPRRLQESIQLYRDIRRYLQELYENQAAERPPISWQEVFEVTQAGFYLDRRQYPGLLRDLVDEVRSGAKRAEKDERPRTLLCGSIIAPGDNKLQNLIEEMGARIVGDDLCTGRRFYQDLEVKDASLEGVAQAYIERLPSAHLVCLRPFDEDKRFLNIVNLAKNYRAEGIIYHTLRYCDPFNFKVVAIRSFLREKLGNFPFLNIYKEYSATDIEAVRTRVETFIDIITSMRAQNMAKSDRW